MKVLEILAAIGLITIIGKTVKITKKYTNDKKG